MRSEANVGVLGEFPLEGSAPRPVEAGSGEAINEDEPVVPELGAIVEPSVADLTPTQS